MKTFIGILSLLALLLLSCKHEKLLDKSSCDVMWKDIDSLVNYSKDYKVYYLDSSWSKRMTNIADTNFIKANLVKIDFDLSTFEFLNGQGFKYDFFLLDTLKNESNGVFVLLLGRYLNTLDPHIINQINLFLLTMSGNKVITSYRLAHTRENSFEYSIKTSVILPGVKIISRTYSSWCSDFIIDNIQKCGWETETDFNTYDPQVERFIPYKNSIREIVHYDNKMN